MNRRAMQAICCRAWGVTPDVYRERLESGKISFADVIAQFRLEIISHPLTADVLSEFVFPGQKAARVAAERQARHDADNASMYALLAGMRERRLLQEKTE